MYRRDPRRPAGMVGIRMARRCWSVIGIEPAVFRDTRGAARDSEGRARDERQSRHLLDLLLAALAGRDTQLQNLAAGELALESEHGEGLRPRDRAIIEKSARNVRVFPICARCC